ncbi:MAG: Hsp20/alpha crystallin family protein [Candidatus Thorarchaeota archaeon]
MSLIRRDRRWGLDPFQEVSRLEDEMRNLFANVFGDRDLALRDRIFAPLVDVRELDDKFIVEADIPGFKKEDITIDVTPESIEISAEHNMEEKEEKTEKDGKYLRRERVAFRFHRSISLPTSIDTEKIETVFKDGTLHLDLPKMPGTGRKRLTL